MKKLAAGKNPDARLSIRSRAPKATNSVVRRVMQANTGRATTPEKKLRSLARAVGLRFRVGCKPEASLRCHADLTFMGAKVCVFVDGCFWHGCPKHFVLPKSNSAWWAEKIADNRARDKRRTAELKRHGWIVIRVWEHHINEDVAARTVVTSLARLIQKRAVSPFPIGRSGSIKPQAKGGEQ